MHLLVPICCFLSTPSPQPPPLVLPRPPSRRLCSPSPRFGLPFPYPRAVVAPAMRRRRRGAAPLPPAAAAAGEASSDVPGPPGGEDKRDGTDLKTLARRFWKVAAPYWWSEDKVQARLQLAAVFALTLATTGISVGFNFLGRDFYNALADKDQEKFTKQLLYYLGGFAVGIPFFVLRDYAREVLSLRWRSWMTSYYMKRYFKNRTFYKIQSQSLIDNPDQRINDDLSSFTGTALAFSLTILNAIVDLVSFSNILYGIYPPLFIVLIVYSLGGTVISVFLGKNLVNLNFMQEKKEVDFGLVRVRENAESIAFYGGEENELQLLLDRFRRAYQNLSELLLASRNLEFFTNGYQYFKQGTALFQARQTHQLKTCKLCSCGETSHSFSRTHLIIHSTPSPPPPPPRENHSIFCLSSYLLDMKYLLVIIMSRKLVIQARRIDERPKCRSWRIRHVSTTCLAE